jgi:putative DNA primase/helicase
MRSHSISPLNLAVIFATRRPGAGGTGGPEGFGSNTHLVPEFVRHVCRLVSTKCLDKNLQRKIASASTVAAVERLARSDRQDAATVDQWDSDPWMLNTLGGTIDLSTGELRPSQREDYCTKVTAAAPGDACPLWMAFLSRVTDGNVELQCYLQRICGYLLTGSTREQVWFFLYGTGANGKSVFINTIAGVMGDYARPAPIDFHRDDVRSTSNRSGWFARSAARVCRGNRRGPRLGGK